MLIIGYIRVSTQKQGESGLGLDAQIAAIELYARGNAGEIVQIYREIESGTHPDRPELKKAIEHARKTKARLVIAKLDRLARSVRVVSGLMDSHVDFIACDNPHANRLTLHILAAVAEDEGRRTSERTKEALAIAKSRGVLLGSARPGHWKGREQQRHYGAIKGANAERRRWARETAPTYEAVRPLIAQLRAAKQSIRDIAGALNAGGYTTYSGKPWQFEQVRRLLPKEGVRDIIRNKPLPPADNQTAP